MKTIEQLGISPAPWYIEENTGVLCAKSEYYKHSIVDDCGEFENSNDKRLIAAAPDLYKCLHDAIIAICRMCQYCSVHQSYECKGLKRKCFVKVWRKVIADAAGKEEQNDNM